MSPVFSEVSLGLHFEDFFLPVSADLFFLFGSEVKEFFEQIAEFYLSFLRHFLFIEGLGRAFGELLDNFSDFVFIDLSHTCLFGEVLVDELFFFLW